MSMEWRYGKIMDDDEIEQYWQFCERQQAKKDRAGLWRGIRNAALAVGPFWLFLMWWLFR